MLGCRMTALAYETLQTQQGELPCLMAMSEVAGRMAVQEGAKYLQDPMQGRGILLGGRSRCFSGGSDHYRGGNSRGACL